MSPALVGLWAAAVVATSGAGASNAAPAAAPVVGHVVARRTATRPTIDGKLDEPVWRTAPAAGGFTQKVPDDGAAPSDATTVRVLYDDEAIYIGFDCPQPHTPVVERLTRRDRVVETDSVTVALGTRGDHKSAFEFYVSASGTMVDAIRFNDTDYSADWDENWEASTHVTKGGWSAELRIPLRILRFPSTPVQSWDFQATRNISMRQESDVWAYFPRTAGGEVSHYGRLDGVEGLSARAPIELRPFVLGRARRRDPAVGQLASGTDFLASAGLDLKWHPKPDLTLDATFNPDFAQVEADQVVLNLSTVATYYPEKRPFFLEGIDAYSTAFQLLYTRRIGAAPPIPSLRTDPVNNEQLVDVPGASTIHGATKLTGRLADGWSLGTVQALTAPNQVQVQLGSGARVARTVAPLTLFNVARLKHDLGDNADVGVMFTSATHAESPEGYPVVAPGPYSSSPTTSVLCPTPSQLTPLVQRPLQVAPLGRCFDDAYVGAADWRWRAPGGEFVTGGQVAATVLENGPGRPVADGTIVNPGAIGWGAHVYLQKDGGKHWLAETHADVESRQFEINDLGYNDRANQISGYANIEYRDLTPSGAFRETHEYSSVRVNYNQSWLPLGTEPYLVAYGRFSNLWSYGADIHYLSTRFDDREVGDGTALQRSWLIGNETTLATDSTKRVALSLDQVTEVLGNGLNLSGNAALTVRVLPQFDFDLIPTWQWTRGEPRFAGNGAASGQYLFGQLEAKSLGLTVRTTYTFTPRLTLQGYAQLFLASGHYSQFTDYDSSPAGPRATVHLDELVPYTGAIAANPDFEQGVLNMNVVFRWEYILGSTIYLVYTRSQVPTTVLGASDVGALNLGAVRSAPASDALLLKLTYWWAG